MQGAVPDWCVLPVCYGDALAGLWQGFRELYGQRAIARLPRLVAAEVHGSLTAALAGDDDRLPDIERSEEHTYALQSLMRTPYAAFWLKNKTTDQHIPPIL